MSFTVCFFGIIVLGIAILFQYIKGTLIEVEKKN